MNHHEVFSKQQEWFNQILNNGKKQGLLKSDMDNMVFTMTFIGAINMYIMAYLKGDIQELSEESAIQVVEVLLNGIKK